MQKNLVGLQPNARGFMLDLAKGHIEIPPERLSSTRSKLKVASQLAKITARELASIVGRIISMGLAIVPVSCLMTRSMYMLLNSRRSWGSPQSFQGGSPGIAFLEGLPRGLLLSAYLAFSIRGEGGVFRC